MSAKRWRIRLTCKHWSEDMTSAERTVAHMTNSELTCPTCGQVARPTDTEQRGGRRPGSWTEALQREQQYAEMGIGQVQVRADGLAVRLLDKFGKREWWCRACDGKRPLSKGAALPSLDAVLVEWDQHIKSDQHVRELRGRRLMESVAEQIAPR